VKINIDEIASLKQKRVTLDFDEVLEIPELAEPRMVSGSVTASVNMGGVKLVGSLGTVFELTCDVCLQPYTLPMEIEIEEQFVFNKIGNNHDSDEPNAYTKEKELNTQDFYEVLPSDKSLDVTDIVYQAVIISLPTYAHCGDGCPGTPLINQAAGKEQSAKDAGDSDKIDPRWESLKNLFQNTEN